MILYMVKLENGKVGLLTTEDNTKVLDNICEVTLCNRFKLTKESGLVVEILQTLAPGYHK